MDAKTPPQGATIASDLTAEAFRHEEAGRYFGKICVVN